MKAHLLLFCMLPLFCFGQERSFKNYRHDIIGRTWHFFVKKEEHGVRRINTYDVPSTKFIGWDSTYRSSGGSNGKFYVKGQTLRMVSSNGTKRTLKILSCDGNFLWLRDSDGTELWGISIPSDQVDMR